MCSAAAGRSQRHSCRSGVPRESNCVTLGHLSCEESHGHRGRNLHYQAHFGGKDKTCDAKVPTIQAQFVSGLVHNCIHVGYPSVLTLGWTSEVFDSPRASLMRACSSAAHSNVDKPKHAHPSLEGWI